MTPEQQFIDFFESLRADNLNQISSIFSADARFKDPFNDVVGIDSIRAIFDHMFHTTTNPTFKVKTHAKNNQVLFLHWEFNFNKDKQEWKIDGCSKVTFNQQNQVIEHIDYWDPAEQIYSKVTGLSILMKFIRSKLTAN